MAGKTILVVEDEENLVELLKFRLESNGYKVETALDGKEGLSKIKKIKPDIIILDLMMPKIHGIDVCRISKNNAATKKIPIIILTARTQQSDLVGARECGADAFIAKPFEPSVLLEEIERLIKK